MYRAKITFWAPGNRHIVKGDLIAPHDDVITGRENLFEAVVIPQAIPPAAATPEQHDQADAGAQEPTVQAGPDDTTSVDSPDDAHSEQQTGDTPPAEAKPAAAAKPAARKTTTTATKRAGGAS